VFRCAGTVCRPSSAAGHPGLGGDLGGGGGVLTAAADIINADQTSFLPNSYESVQAQELASEAFPQASAATVTGVVKRADGGSLAEAGTQRVQRLATELSGAGIDRVAAAQTAPQAVSPNRSVQLVTVALQGTPQDEIVRGDQPQPEQAEAAAEPAEDRSRA
jgi:uncharacterized membrane protein YdfJ with MMPL/SSD domain